MTSHDPYYLWKTIPSQGTGRSLVNLAKALHCRDWAVATFMDIDCVMSILAWSHVSLNILWKEYIMTYCCSWIWTKDFFKNLDTFSFLTAFFQLPFTIVISEGFILSPYVDYSGKIRGIWLFYIFLNKEVMTLFNILVGWQTEVDMCSYQPKDLGLVAVKYQAHIYCLHC